MDIKGYNNLYEIDDKFNIYRKGYWIVQKNSHGEYKRYMKPKLVKQTIDKEGYYSVSLSGKRVRLHRIIYENFVGEIPNGCVIDHKDRNKLNNSISNLRAVAQTINARNAELAIKPDIRKVGNKYSLRFSSGGVRKYYGVFNSFSEAKEQYNKLYQERQKYYYDVGLYL